MFNTSLSNPGYIGHSRSVRSQKAINNYRVPMNMITDRLIQGFKNNDRTVIYRRKIFKLKAKIWRYTAELIGTDEFHHTGKYYSITSHYSLWRIADYLSKHYHKVLSNYAKQKRKKYKTVKLAIIKVKTWRKCKCDNGKIEWKFGGYRTLYGFINNNTITPCNDDKDLKYSRFAKKVSKYKIISNLYDFEDYLSMNENIRLDFKSFIEFLHQNKVDCEKINNSNPRRILIAI